MGRPFAAFDIDGTIIRWQLYHAIGDRMAKHGIIDAVDFQRVRRARMNWKQRAGEDSFRDYELTLVEVFDKALTGLKVDAFKRAVGGVFDEYKEQVYVYTRDLIEHLRQKDYLLFAISGSPAMIVRLFSDYYGFDDFAATEYPTDNGVFTGVKKLSLGRKPELLQQLIEKHNAESAGSIVVGDSEGDIGMLELAEQPIAFNPSKGLFEHARQAGWRVVLERKNMVYELEPKDGTFILAQTNAD